MTSKDKLKQLSTLVGSRGRAVKYGRPEPDRDYDRTVFSDDTTERAEVLALLKQLVKEDSDFRFIDRGAGNATAASDAEDYNLYSTAKRDQIYKAWELQEQGLSKPEAWDIVNRQDLVKKAAKWRSGPNLLKILERLGVSTGGSFSGQQKGITRAIALTRVRDALKLPESSGLPKVIDGLNFKSTHEAIPKVLISGDDFKGTVDFLFRGHAPGGETLSGYAKKFKGVHATPFLQDADKYGGGSLGRGNSLVSAFKPTQSQRYNPDSRTEFGELGLTLKEIIKSKITPGFGMAETIVTTPSIGTYITRNRGQLIAKIPEDTQWGKVLASLGPIDH